MSVLHKYNNEFGSTELGRTTNAVKTWVLRNCSPQGHYDGYSQEYFNALIEALGTVTGKFLLSSYRNEVLTQAEKLHGWYQIEMKINTNPTASNKSRTKIEVLTANYPIGVVDGKIKRL